MSAQKVCILTSVHQPDDIRIFHKQAKTLRNAGYKVVLVAPCDQDKIVDETRIRAVKVPRNRIVRMLITTWRIFGKGFKEKADIYHFHDPELIPVGLLLKLLGRKVIYDVHELYGKQTLYKHYLPPLVRPVVGWCINFIEQSTASFFDAIVTARDDILKNFKSHSSAVAVRNFPILSNFSLSRNSRDENEHLTLIYVGVLTEARGITQIVQALEYVESSYQIRLILCGKFVPASYEQQVRNLTGFTQVEYLGWVALQDVPATIAQADIGIVCFLPEPNHISTMPTKLFEYMAAGLPVIASNFPLWKEIVEEHGCGLCVDPANPKQIAKAIEYLMARPELRKEMGENGRRAVVEKYNWANEAEKLLELYQRILKN